MDGCVGRDRRAHRSPARGANCDANKSGDSARRSPKNHVLEPEAAPIPGPDESADHKANHGMLAAPGTGSTPCPVFFEKLGNPLPEIEPCPVLLFAMKQTGPGIENVPTVVVTLQGLETKDTW
jgi:hypothetical protein